MKSMVAMLAIGLAPPGAALARTGDVEVFTSMPPSGFLLIQPDLASPSPNTSSPEPATTTVTSGLGAFLSQTDPPPADARSGVFMLANLRSTDRNDDLLKLYEAAAQFCSNVAYRPHPALDIRQEARRQRHFPQMVEAACFAGVPVELFDALIIQESRYNPFALSARGAAGMAQLMPTTAQGLGVKNTWNIAQNLGAGARYLRTQFDRFRDWSLALAAYNAGPASVRKYASIPPYRETRDYVARVLTLSGWRPLPSAAVPQRAVSVSLVQR